MLLEHAGNLDEGRGRKGELLERREGRVRELERGRKFDCEMKQTHIVDSSEIESRRRPRELSDEKKDKKTRRSEGKVSLDKPVCLLSLEVLLLDLLTRLFEPSVSLVFVVGSLGVGGDFPEQLLLLVVLVELARLLVRLDPTEELLVPLLVRQIRASVSDDSRGCRKETKNKVEGEGGERCQLA